MSPFVRCAWSSEKPQITSKEIERNIRCCCFTMARAYHGYISPRSHLVGKPRCRRLARKNSLLRFNDYMSAGKTPESGGRLCGFQFLNQAWNRGCKVRSIYGSEDGAEQRIG